MKQTAILRTFMAITLTLLLLLAAPAALAEETDTTAFDANVWNMTVEDMLALEDATKADGEYEIGGGAYIQYAFQHEGDGYTYAAIYVFYGEQLVIYGNYTDALIQDAEVTFGDIYQEWTASATEAYGDPLTEDKQSGLAIATAVVAEDWVTLESIESFAGWMPAEGVGLYCMHFTGEDGDIVYAVYLYTALLFAA